MIEKNTFLTNVRAADVLVCSAALLAEFFSFCALFHGSTRWPSVVLGY